MRCRNSQIGYVASRVANKILILEDTAARVAEMRAVMLDLLPEFELIVFDNVPDLLAWMEENLAHVALICLDHDLGPTRKRDEQPFDPGIGRDVVDVLAMRPP